MPPSRPAVPPTQEAFFVVLDYLINLYRTVDPSPFEIRTVEADSEEVAHLLKGEGHDWITVDVLFDLLKHEPLA